MKFSLRILFIITLIVACWLVLLPQLRAYNAIQHLSNTDLRVDGNYFGLDVRISGDAASTLERLGSSANSWLLDAFDDSAMNVECFVDIFLRWRQRHTLALCSSHEPLVRCS